MSLPLHRAMQSGGRFVPVLLALLIGASGHLASQTVRTPAPVTVALVNELPGVARSYPAAVMRRADGGDVILLMRSAASADLLEAATQALVHSRKVHGARPTKFRGRVIRRSMVLGVRLPVRPRSTGNTLVPDADGLLQQLQVAPETLVSSVGRVRTITFVPRVPTRRNHG